MFILRHVPENGTAPTNHFLGKHYRLVQLIGNHEEFVAEAKNYWENHKSVEGLFEDGYYAFIISPEITIPLKRNGNNYIMTETGSTFENVTCRIKELYHKHEA